MAEPWIERREIGPCTLYLGDSRDIVPHIEPAGLVVTSPPYWRQRKYGAAQCDDWSAIPQILAAMPTTPDCQILVVIGLVRRGRLIRYWDRLIDAMESAGRQLADWYVWDKLSGIPGEYHGRLAPEHEWVFHFRAGVVRAARNVPCKAPGVRSTFNVRKADGGLYHHTKSGRVRTHKQHGSVFRAHTCKSNTERTGHPAQMPVALAAEIMSPWPDLAPVGDPFWGSGTTCEAALRAGRRCWQIERNPEYHATACDRIARVWQEIAP